MRHPIAAIIPLVLCLASRAAAMQAGAEATVLPAAAGGASAWPQREASLVREVEVGPWELRWVGEFPLGGLPADAAAGAAIGELLGEEAAPLRFEGPGSVVVRMPMGEVSATDRLAGRPAAAYEHISAAEGDDGAVQLQRTWFALYEPRSEAGESPAGRGTVVLLPGMFGTPEPVVDGLVGRLRSRGWHVLRMLTHPSRFTERASYTLGPGGDIAGLAESIAADFDERAGECALAVEAVCARIAESRPDVPIARRVGLGMSGGGMVLATVIARERAAYDAVVLIGAGCDFAQIAIESNYADWIDSVRIAWRGDASEEDRRAFTSAYRAAAALDSYNTAPLLDGMPALMIHGEADQAVPAAMGDLLWERLGRPERWSQPLGHETLFLVYLPAVAEKLLDWLDAATDR